MSLRYPNEHVLVVPRSLFDELGAFEGLAHEVERYLPRLLDPASNYFLQRDEAEHDPSRKQIISYAIFHHGGRVLRYFRSKKTGEQRLAAKASLGIGGHINTEDAAGQGMSLAAYMAGVEREIAEELKISGGWRQRIVALLNDESNEVGQVHLGVVHCVELDTDAVESNEDSIADIAFMTPEALRAERDRLETWSQICLDGLETWMER